MKRTFAFANILSTIQTLRRKLATATRAAAILGAAAALFFSPSAAKADCSLNIYPSSLALVSFDGVYYSLASGTFLALTNEAGCVIVQEQTLTYGPLWCSTGTPLPAGEQYVPCWDDGSALPYPYPYVPYFTAGTVAWAYLNPFNGTSGVANAYVTLTVIPIT